ncbi:hypothetical protein [Sphaerisporangium sp. TRM90804]|uniref:hypothetical protein n=1 Tax=Sphaerisporangium sp. TRM90804 TaxID=3031113 RepID=UPI00244B8A5C|nr:hypothetical protein [Sphaerisporangium sp. TRM90804]MDH2428293.1 hypothetical protein [Sphaerisporangium sp. TRM90804]
MGLKSQIERWFGEWIEEWAARHLGERVDAHVQAWADANLGDLDARVGERLREWSAGQLKDVLERDFGTRADSFVEEKFDLRFFTWADTWADQKLKARLDEHFDGRFQEHLDDRLKARVANEIDGRIDRRIGQWLRIQQARQAQQATASQPQDAPSQSAEQRPADTLVTAAELAQYLQRVHLGSSQVRRLLKGRQAHTGKPYMYRLGDAASWILLRERSAPKGEGARRGAGPGQGREQSA